MIRTDEEIQTQLNWLKENKKNIRRFSAFGDDNHEKVDAQIRVLSGRLSYDEVYDLGLPENAESAASDAVAWLTGDEDTPPSIDWKPLLSGK